MALKVALPFRSQAALMCERSKQMLRDAGFELLCNEKGMSLSREEQKEMIRDAFAIVAGTEKYDAEMLAGCDSLKVIVRFGVGVDNFDLDTMKRMGIQVGVISNCNAVAEFALTLILSALKNLPRYDAAAREAKWSRFPMYELSQKTVGIVGFGRIGRRLNELLAGFGARVLVYDPFVSKETVAQQNAEAVSLEELMRESDVVSLHLPSTPENYHMMNAERIAQMKDGAYLVSTSRGTLVDELALVDALRRGKLSGAGIDVYEKEPLNKDDPLLPLENVVLAPHVSALTHETNYNGGILCARSIINVRDGLKPVYPVI